MTQANLMPASPPLDHAIALVQAAIDGPGTIEHLGRGKVEIGTRGIAVFSADRQYRYALMRSWDPERAHMVWVLCNPSTADADKDDPTIRRCIAYAKQWGFGGLTILNIWAYRATDPAVMHAQADPIGPANDAALYHLTEGMPLVVCGWGENGRHRDRGHHVMMRLSAPGHPIYALRPPGKGVYTSHDQPRHPLYLPRCADLVKVG